MRQPEHLPRESDRRELLRMLGRLDPWPDARAVGDGLGRAAHMATNPSATFKTPIARLAAGRRRFRTLADAGCHFELRQMADLRANEHIVGDVPIASVLSASAQGQ